MTSEGVRMRETERKWERKDSRCDVSERKLETGGCVAVVAL